MILGNISQCVSGWFVGDFPCAVFRTPAAECAHHRYRRGTDAKPHTHRVATEVNYVLSGRLYVDGHLLGPGSIFVYEPNEVSNVKFLMDTELIVFKTPSVPGDKYDA